MDKKKTSIHLSFCILVRPEGVEPPTFRFVAERSIQLSYGRKSYNGIYIILFLFICQVLVNNLLVKIKGILANLNFDNLGIIVLPLKQMEV